MRDNGDSQHERRTGRQGVGPPVVMQRIVTFLFARRVTQSLGVHFILTALWSFVVCLLYVGYAYLNRGVW